MRLSHWVMGERRHYRGKFCLEMHLDEASGQAESDKVAMIYGQAWEKFSSTSIFSGLPEFSGRHLVYGWLSRHRNCLHLFKFNSRYRNKNSPNCGPAH